MEILTLIEYLSFERVLSAIAVFLVFMQFRQSNKIAVLEFEESFDRQYRELMLPIPVSVLMTGVYEFRDYEPLREYVYNYLDLSNEQCFLASRGKFSKQTWVAWRAGMQSHMKKKIFTEVFEEVMRHNPNAFTYLRDQNFELYYEN